MGKSTVLPTLILAAVLAALAGCDSSATNSSDNNGNTVSQTTIGYEVTGTYRTCNIVYAGENGDPVDVGEVALDWADSVKVSQNQNFLARLSAMCADLLLEGKATLLISVDGEPRATDSVIGYGDSTSVQFLVQSG